MISPVGMSTLRLIEQSELVLSYGTPEIEEQANLLPHVVVQAMGKKTETTPLLRLGAIQRGIGVAQQCLCLSVAAVTGGDADAGAAVQLGSVDRKRCGNGLHQLSRQDAGIRWMHQMSSQYGELIAAETRCQVSVANGCAQPPGNRLQQEISDCVS